jgi:hypothetical protein
MARQETNQIQPVARPVQAFIEPVRVSIAEPARPAQLPGMGQIQTVQQGGTPNVAGFNSFERLAGNLETFNRQLTPVLQQMGLQYADAQMRQGEARARAEALQGMVQNDVAIENAEGSYNKANRALAKRDPQAAGIMAVLNPYEQIGYERGQAKLAGSEVAIGLPEHIRQHADQIDYTTPDQGQGAIRLLTDQYTAGVMKRYGLTADNPMAQRFVVPEVEKAREKMGLQIMKDRSDAIKQSRIGQTGALLYGMWNQAQSDQAVEYKGQIYKKDNPMFAYALREKMQEVLAGAVTSGVMPGDGREIQEKVYKSLKAQGWFTDNESFRRVVDSLESTDKMLDANGKEVIDPRTQKPLRLTLGEVYRIDDIDAQIKYGQARREQRRANAEDVKIQAEVFLYNRIGAIPPGPQREAARAKAITDFANVYADKLNAAGITLFDLQKQAKEIGDLTGTLFIQDQPNPGAPDAALSALSERYGSAWNARDAYREGQVLAGTFRDPKEGGKFLIRWNAEVNRIDKDRTDKGQYQAPLNDEMNRFISSQVITNYRDGALRKGDQEESKNRQRRAYRPLIDAALGEAERKKGGKLTDSEVRTTALSVMQGYGKSDPDQKAWLFPGSKYSQTPGVTPQTKPRATTQPAPAAGATPKPLPTVYGVSQLDSIPDRKLLLRNYDKKPVLSAPGLNELIQTVAQDRPWPKSFERAWRDSGARTPGEFIMRQLENYPGVFQLPPKLQQKIQKRASAEAGAGDFMASLQAARARFPQLANLAMGSVLDVVTGARPSYAAVRYEQPSAAMPNDGGGGGGLDVRHPTLARLATGYMVPTRPGLCTTAVLETLAANGLPNPRETGRDAGNNPRGLASQLINGYGWQPLPGLGQPQTLRSPYGTFSANVIPEAEYQAAVRAGRIPSGALVFSTRHGSWQGASPGSRGYDVAVARNGGRNLWNGYLNRSDVHRGGSTLRMVLIPRGASINNVSRN